MTWESEQFAAVERQLRHIGNQVDMILNRQEIEMGQADDLNNAVTALATGYAALHAAQATEITALNSALAGVANVPPAVSQAISNITAISASMAKDAADLTASIPAATTVAAPPAPAPVAGLPAPTVTPPDIGTAPITAPAAQPPSTPPPSATTAPVA